MSNSAHLIRTSHEVLDTLEDISASAKSYLNKSTWLSEDCLADGDSADVAMYERQSKIRSDCKRLSTEPAIARIVVNGRTFYICRGSTIADSPDNLASYYSDIGRLAEKNLGDGGVTERTIIRPQMLPDGWDSNDTVFQSISYSTVTVRSLRELNDTPTDKHSTETKSQPTTVTSKKAATRPMPNAFDNDFDNEDFDMEEIDSPRKFSEPNIVEGIRRSVISKMGLRDQPILDQYQGEIFRLPLDKRLMILGPPGTGKTTTLIHRLGLKLSEHLTDEEKNLINQIYNRQKLPHSKSWLMFTPKELLKHYLKEAFARADVPASNREIRTWDDYRRELARDVFNVLRKSKGDGFILNEESETLHSVAITEPIQWYESFNSWQCQSYIRELIAASASQNQSIDFARLTEETRKAIGSVDNQLRFSRPSTHREFKQLDKQVAQREQFEERLKNIARLQTLLSRIEATKNTTSFESLIIDLVGIRSLVKEINRPKELTSIDLLPIFDNPVKHYIDGISRRYGDFRSLHQNESQWYKPQAVKSSSIHPLELDVVLLAILRTLNKLTDLAWDDLDNKAWTLLRNYLEIFRNQILVDEATDFSPIQLACMAALAHPRLKSFFACGDFNQRVTSWGTRSPDELSWIFPDFDTREITIAYRQSQQLNDFAKGVIRATTGSEPNITLPDRTDNAGVSPALIEHAKDQAVITSWLADRICEIEEFVDGRQPPSTAIFVNSEDEVKPVATALNDALAEYNRKVVACHGGQTVGQESNIRVFDIQHIKGLEFEAVFFIDIDKLAKQLPDLFDKYLYVGATRAATYLGITCETNLPHVLKSLQNHFTDDWKI